MSNNHFSKAYPAYKLSINDLLPIIELANSHRTKIENNNNNEHKTELYDHNKLLEDAYYALGGDYPDQETLCNGEDYGFSRLSMIEHMIPIMNISELDTLIRDIKIFIKIHYDKQ